MRTEDDLRAALVEEAARALDPEGVRQRIQLELASAPRRKQGRWVVAAAVAVVVLAVAIVAARLTAPDRPVAQPSTAEPTSGASEPPGRQLPGRWAMVSTIEPPSGWSMWWQSVTQTFETTGLTPSGSGKPSCTVEVDRPGAAPRDPLPVRSEAVRVGSQSARFGRQAGSGTDVVYWRHGGGAWASVTCFGEPKKIILALAARVRFGHFPIPLPVGLKQIPAGFAVSSVSMNQQHPQNSWSVDLSSVAPEAAGLAISIGSGPALPGTSTSWMRGDGRRATLTRWVSSGPVGHLDITLCVENGRGGVCLQPRNVRPPTSVSDAQISAVLSRVCDQLIFAPSPDDPSTWFASDAVLPQRH